MTTYNTGNPVGSTDVRDLYDNAQNLDSLVNGPLASYDDRLGAPRKSWRGIEQDFAAFLAASGFELPALEYVGGSPLVVDRPTQLIERSGSPGVVYSIKLPSNFPVTLSGAWSTDESLLVVRVDKILREDLAAASAIDEGAGIVGHNPALIYPDGTAGAAIRANKAGLDAAAASINDIEEIASSQFSASLSPLVVDMHYGTLCGSGWTASEPPFSLTGYSIAASGPVSVGAMDIPVTSTTNFAAGMLIAYVATDGRFYPARIHSINAGPSLRLDRQTVAPIAAGGLVWNVYRDDAHPNAAGANLIVDDALRQLDGGRLRKMEWRGNDGSIWRAIGGASLASVTDVAYTNPGTVTVGERPASVTGSGVGQGVRSAPVGLVGGDYIARVVLNTGLRDGGFSGAVEVAVDETRADGQTSTIATCDAFVGYNGTVSVEVPFSSAHGSVLSIRITSPSSGGWVFTAGALEYHRLEGQALKINRGRHVLLGDSWFVSGGAIHNSMIARLPDAEVISAGIVGNTAAQLIARFDTDVAPLAPDYVWVMVGTNDYYAGITPQLFEQQILQLRRMIQEIGAQPIFFTPSVGAVTFVPQQLHPSRRYALNVNYHEVAPAAIGPGVYQRSGIANVQGLSVAAGATVTAWVFPATTRRVAYLRFLAVSTAGVNVRFEYCSTPDGSGGVDPTIYNTTDPVRDAPLPRASDTALRFICIRVNNPIGSPVSVSLVADVAWYQDLI